MEALYRRYRPTKFSEIVGQEHIKRLLKNALRNKKINHAYIFAGPRGTGKTTTARILAKSLNCENNQYGEPCNECSSCRAIDSGSHLDVIELDAASNRGIDEVRKIRDGVNFTPVMGKYKVYIIDEVHMLTREAFNALLKTLEEPPGHVVFVLATTNPEKIPPTIISRCHVLEFRNISKDEMTLRLREISSNEGYDISDDALEKIVKKASGGLRDALSILEQVVRYSGGEITGDVVNEALGLVSDETVDTFLEAILLGNVDTIDGILEEVYMERGDFDTFLSQVVEKAIERRDSHNIKIASEIYKIQKELKNTEEKLLIGKVLFLDLTMTIPKTKNSLSAEPLINNDKSTAGFSKLEKTTTILSSKSEAPIPEGKNQVIDKSESSLTETRDKLSQDVTYTNSSEVANESSNDNEAVLSEKLVTKEILEELKLTGDLSIFVGLSLANVYELSDVIRVVFDKSKQFSYEILKEKKDQIKLLYEKKSGKKREVVVEIADEDHDPVLEKLKILFGD
ncbi:DNA polymerase III subunit gamma/tau [Fervidobacterium sp.]